MLIEWHSNEVDGCIKGLPRHSPLHSVRRSHTLAQAKFCGNRKHTQGKPRNRIKNRIEQNGERDRATKKARGWRLEESKPACARHISV